ncbi:hypothetical protein CRUP_008343 [Coryphaenoides rupestris]|nr:hypothetical protein CRUP_008343 [Coryphaenoides rupestris]
MFHQNGKVYDETRKAHYTTKAVLELSVVIVSANVIIILAISRDKSLHQPMLLRDLLQETHLISRPECFTQIYVIYTYASYEFTILSMMAYDRYVAVCKPLHYHSTMTSKMVSKLALFAWIYPAFSIGTCVYFSVRLPMCGSKIPKVFCANWPVVKLSCVNTFLNNVLGMIVTITTIFIPLLFVLYTYFKILLICRKRSAQFKWKVFQSCLPHVVTFFNYSITVFCDVTLSRLNFEKLNPILAVMLSLEFVVIPPILNPLMYGLKLPEMKRSDQVRGHAPGPTLVNSLYGSAGFFPRFLRDLLQEIHLISQPGCFSQIYVIYTYASYEFTILSMMAYDRYVAVCKPLQYHSTMTSKMVSKLALFAWIYPAFSIGICAFLSFRLPLCVIVSANVIIILAISRDKSLHQPMYVLIACLSVNSLYGSAGFFPRLLRDLLQETHLISRPECFTQIYVIYTYASYEFTILSMMAYDRYVAVCKPLHYHSTMTSKMVSKLATHWKL